MPAPVHACAEHGYHEGEQCPDCSETGERVLSGERRRRCSKFVSGALRHFPDDAGIDLDRGGWAALADVAAAVDRKYDWAGREALEAIVATDPKGRFERAAGPDGPLLRAAYGHSVEVDLDATPEVAEDAESGDDGNASNGAASDDIPAVLYHGTAPRNLGSIRAEGLNPMNRQRVHLSGTVEAAREVGARHADDPVVLTVDAAAMLADGHRIARRGREVYTTEAVPPTYLDVREE